jgi:hypothetical protein
MPKFTKGQPVRIHLDKNLSLDGEVAPREAKFVDYLHGQPDWAVIEFEKAHHGGVKTLHVPVAVIGACQ